MVYIDSQYGARDWKNAYGSLQVSVEEWFSQLGENMVLFFFSPSYPNHIGRLGR